MFPVLLRSLVLNLVLEKVFSSKGTRKLQQCLPSFIMLCSCEAGNGIETLALKEKLGMHYSGESLLEELLRIL